MGAFTIRERCRQCGLRFQSEEGDWLAAATISYGVAGVVWMAMLVVWLSIELPDVDVASLVLWSIAVVVGIGLACSRPAKTTWSALVLLLSGAHKRLDAHDAARLGLNGPDDQTAGSGWDAVR